MSSEENIILKVHRTLNDALKNLKGDTNKKFLNNKNKKKSKQKRVVDMVLLGAARAIYEKSTPVEKAETGNHQNVVNFKRDLRTDWRTLVFYCKVMAYYFQIKKRTDPKPHFVIFKPQKCVNLMRSFFEIGWNQGEPSFSDIISSNEPENPIIKDLLLITKDFNIEELPEEEEETETELL